MATIRSATHAGSWYSADPVRLESQIKQFFAAAATLSKKSGSDDVSHAIPGARILIGPHAGYTYSGARLAETFNVWDTSNVKRVFMLGPSHHVYFRSKALVSGFDQYETPLGNIDVDTEIVQQLVQLKDENGRPVFDLMSDEVDEDEHSFEMHAPFLYYATKHLPQGVPKIIPIMVSGLDETLRDGIVAALAPFLDDKENAFVISSDFCHWGSRFGYTNYVSGEYSGDKIQTLTSRSKIGQTPIFKSIETLDKHAMKIAGTGSYKDWDKYIKESGNTICGQKPIGIILKLLSGYDALFSWIGYSQSSSVTSYHDSSVSYASGYVKLETTN